jgi:hypothetical protein
VEGEKENSLAFNLSIYHLNPFFALETEGERRRNIVPK